jgi:hypothetical protein
VFFFGSNHEGVAAGAGDEKLFIVDSGVGCWASCSELAYAGSLGAASPG